MTKEQKAGELARKKREAEADKIMAEQARQWAEQLERDPDSIPF